MGHNPDPAAEAEELRGLIRDAHAAVKDLRAAMREARQLGAGLAGDFEVIANSEVMDMANQVQQLANEMTVSLNASVEAARLEIVQRLGDARIQYDKAADNFVVVFQGAKFTEGTPLPYPERMTPP